MNSLKLDILKYIPISKTMIKDCTLLELQSGEHELENFLKRQPYLSDDLFACYNILRYRNLGIAYVQNFRSLCIGLIVLKKIKGLKYKIIKGKQLSKRKLDIKSSQWQSAKICCGEKTHDKRYHVKIARGVVKRYNNGERISIFNTKDDVYVKLLDYVLTGKTWSSNNPEIDVFQAIFHPEEISDLIKNNRTWKNHETDRTKSILKSLRQFLNGDLVTTDDHRLVIGIALLAFLLNEDVAFKNPNCVNKSFPLFFNVLNTIKHNQEVLK